METKININAIPDSIPRSENFKTINGQSILGSGNITISGSGGSSSGSGAYAEVDGSIYGNAWSLGTYEIHDMQPNTFYIFPECVSLVIEFADETVGVANEYLFQFTSGATATTLTLPDDIKWANDSAPTIAEKKIYQISVLNGLATALEFNSINYILFTIDGYETIAEEGMTWADLVSTDYNKKGLYISGGYVRGFQTTLMIGDNYVRDADSIIPNGTYVLIGAGAGN